MSKKVAPFLSTKDFASSAEITLPPSRVVGVSGLFSSAAKAGVERVAMTAKKPHVINPKTAFLKKLVRMCPPVFIEIELPQVLYTKKWGYYSYNVLFAEP
jgi:hypothetical protein